MVNLPPSSPRTRFGVIYQSEIEPDLDGDIKITPIGASANIDTRIPFVQAVRASAYHDLTDRVTLLASAGWEDWSSLKNQFVSIGGVGSGRINRGWNDTWYVASGVRYTLNDRWMVQTGLRYDSSPVNENHRTADLPSDQQFRFGFGFQHQWRDNINVGANLTYANYGENAINSANLNGRYRRNDLFFFGMNISWSGLWGSGQGGA